MKLTFVLKSRRGHLCVALDLHFFLVKRCSVDVMPQRHFLRADILGQIFPFIPRKTLCYPTAFQQILLLPEFKGVARHLLTYGRSVQLFTTWIFEGRVVPEVPTSITFFISRIRSAELRKSVHRKVRFLFAFGRMVNLDMTDLP
ncbi:hypothetical protein NPIL_518631 [Nephila pilipes]|uniref:Uncharacterized protein n=1 Tax=Nephila pilipes TaxID=299642 RepID=A0A8X6R195_NEPPI|nr:hypothetical protein NPIL_518631 [Nephila pilipes]